MDETVDKDLLAELDRQRWAEQPCACGHPRGLHVEDAGLCCAILPGRPVCPCPVFHQGKAQAMPSAWPLVSGSVDRSTPGDA